MTNPVDRGSIFSSYYFFEKASCNIILSIGKSCDHAGNPQKKILCIEDDHETAALIAEELTDRGFDVQVAYNGLEGFSAIQRLQPHLVLCDLTMLGASGLEVLSTRGSSGMPSVS